MPAQLGRGVRYDIAAGARGAADWLGLAAAPTFAVMALITATWRGAAVALLGGAYWARRSAEWSPMYLLMGAFHSGPMAEADGGPAELTAA